MKTHHGTCLDMGGVGILLRGRSGIGKSDLALRLLAEAAEPLARLVADDRVCLIKKKNQLFASAPPALHGLLEVRGLGLIKMPLRKTVLLGLVVDLVDAGQVERAPEFPKTRIVIKGISLPHIHLCALEASAPSKIRLAVRLLLLSQCPDYPGHK